MIFQINQIVFQLPFELFMWFILYAENLYNYISGGGTGGLKMNDELLSL